MIEKVKNESIEDSEEKLKIELNEESKEKSNLDSNVGPCEDLEEKLTAEMMEREGIKENTELRKKFKKSYFFPICFDDAIVGVNAMTESVIYDYMRVGYLRILFGESTYASYKDTLYGCAEMFRWIERLNNGKAEADAVGKVPPTLCLYKNHVKYWNDVHDPKHW